MTQFLGNRANTIDHIESDVGNRFTEPSGSFASFTEQKTEPPVPIRTRNDNAVPNNRNFQMSRMNMSNDNLKPKHMPERNKVRALEAKMTNIESKPLQVKKAIQKTKIFNKEANQVLQMAAKKDFKRLVQKPPAGVNHLGFQNKNVVTAMRTQVLTHPPNVEESRSAPIAKKQPKLSNVPVLKPTPLEKTPVAQKTLPPQKITTPQKTIPQEYTATAQKTLPPQKLTTPQKTIPQEKTPTAQKTIPPEKITTPQNTVPQEKTPTAQKTITPEKITTPQKTIPHEKTPAAEKIHQEKLNAAQKTIPEEWTTTAQNNNDSTLKNKIQDSDICNPTSNTENSSESAQDINSQGNTEKTTSGPELAQKIDVTHQEKKTEDEKITKESTGDPEKQTTDQSKTEVSSGKKLELDALLAHAVEEELQDIMIQVWQELPDDPVDEEERIAVEKLRNETGDDLRRVLGLNITKRLLNVYNNLFVKMQFTCRPQMGCLTSFLNEYHIANFKRIDKNSNTFAAQMETIEDFDKLCAVKELMCGEAKVSVTPCYKFTQCPGNLKTIYDDTYFYEDSSHEHSEPQKSKNNAQKTKVMTSNKSVVRPAAKAENTEAKSTHNLDKLGNIGDGCTDKLNKTDIKKPANILHKVSGNIKRDSENNDSTSKKPNQSEIKKTVNSLQNDSRNVKKGSTNFHKEKLIESVKVKENIVPNNVKSKGILSKAIAIDNDISAYITKDNSDIDDDDLESCIPENQMEEEDELDDEDILALMSEGVVLDECSGSEDDK